MQRFLLLLLLAGCAADVREVSPGGFLGADIAPPIPVPDITLTDYDGNPYNLADKTRGKVALVFFGFTNCPDICPVHLANIAAVLGKLPDEVQRDVTMIFITTDPARDSLPRMREWVRQFDRRFVGLTGSDSLLVAAQRALGVIPAVKDNRAHGDQEYLVQHAGQVIAATRDGMARVQYPFGTRQRDWARDLPLLVSFGE
ncbi:MAG TPA: SCO family protein [Gemmatimonadales bacterium]|nr:SCO family protein [Gemmatimonadales bacterium]